MTTQKNSKKNYNDWLLRSYFVGCIINTNVLNLEFGEETEHQNIKLWFFYFLSIPRFFIT